MKVLHVVPVIAPDGRFGGPTRVALEQARWLIQDGHDATVAAVGLGFGERFPDHFDGVPVRLFAPSRLTPGRHFLTTVSRTLFAWLRTADFDIAHVHLGRDLLSTWASRVLSRRSPYVVQTHGMIMPTSNPLAPVFDPALTVPALQRAAFRLVLTPEEQTHIRALAPLGNTEVFPNFVDLRSDAAEPPARLSNEVLFLARLAPRKNPVLFAEAAMDLAYDYPDAQFTIAGPDGGQAREVQRIASRSHGNVRYIGPVAPANVRRRMSESRVYVLPADKEPFGLTILEAMAARRPVIVTEGCALAPQIRAAGCGLVVQSDRSSLKAAIRELLDSPPSVLDEMGQLGHHLVRERYSPSSGRLALTNLYKKVLGDWRISHSGAAQLADLSGPTGQRHSLFNRPPLITPRERI